MYLPHFRNLFAVRYNVEKINNIIASPLARLIAIISLIVVVGISVNRCKNSIDRLQVMDKQTEHNIKVGRDTVRITVNKAGFTEYNKLAYIGQIKDLELLNDSLYKSVIAERGKVTNLTNTIVSYETEAIKLTNTIKKLDGDNYGLSFTYAKRDSGSYQNIEGVSRFKLDKISGKLTSDSTILTKNSLELSVTIGQRKTDTGYEFFATSKSPNFVLKDATSFVAFPKAEPQKRFGLGVHVGYGLSFYGNDVKVGPNVSVGLNYNLIKF